MNRLDKQRRTLAVAIAFLAGGVDSLGFLSGDRYFVSFMSGNTTRLAVDVATEPAGAVFPALLIAGFVAGVAGGHLVARWMGRWRKPALLAMIALLLAVAGGLHAAGATGAALGAMVLAMGAVNNTFQRDGEAAVGLTYMTGALVRLGQGIGAAFAGERSRDGKPYLLLWSGLFTGALLGALAFSRLGGATLWLSSLLALALSAYAWRIAAREAA